MTGDAKEGKKPGLLDEMEALEQKRKERKKEKKSEKDSLDLNRAWG